MSAEIIQFGNAARRQINPIGDVDAQRQATSADRLARNTAWKRADYSMRYLRKMLDFFDASFMAAHASVMQGDIERFRELIPIEFDAHIEVRSQIVDRLREATERLLKTPVAFQQQVSWKRPFTWGKGWPVPGDISVAEIEQIIAADEAFLRSCPRKGGGKRKSGVL